VVSVFAYDLDDEVADQGINAGFRPPFVDDPPESLRRAGGPS
jgi:hypothetical protein